jgi:hypothetical protein
MSALSDRDVNAQPTSNPANADKTSSPDLENVAEQPQQQKQLLKEITDINGCVQSVRHNIHSYMN